MAGPEQPRRRFAPVPIETSFKKSKKANDQPSQLQSQSKSNKRIGPDPELTPEPSPRSPSPKPMELPPTRPRRRFAPQLIETSRRSRRVGDKTPATRPADKTDITPYTKNIYTTIRHRRRRGDDEHEAPMPPTRRETEDEGVKEYLLELQAKEAERQMQEAALAAFPNSRAREGGVDHFYFRESSESDEAPEEVSHHHDGYSAKPRRQSSDLGMNWWHKHMQEHAKKQVAHDKEHEHDHDQMEVDEPEKKVADTVKRTDSDLDKMDLTAPPDPMWITTNKQASPTHKRDSLPGPKGPIGETHMPLIAPDPFFADRQKEKAALPAPVPTRPIVETSMPFIPSAPVGRVDLPFAKPGQIPADTGGFRNHSPFGRPFGGLGGRERPPTSRFHRQQKQVSPPMLGKDIKFRRCPSPKQTKLEPDHAFSAKDAAEKNRDLSGKGGLWRGYCYRSGSNDDCLVPAQLQAPQPISTPKPPATPGEEMDGMYFGFHAPSKEPAKLPPLSSGLWTPVVNEHRLRNGEAKGLHMLHGIEERLQKEKAQAELDEKIAQEFDDAFVTQVYNYLSLGYPATARAFDQELSKISRIPILDLEADDEKRLAKGHLLEEDNSTPRDQRCPRWKALHKYITEWARQHPDLDNLEPSGWGVRERRGSWAI